MARILIIAPSFRIVGGVSNYYREVARNAPSNVSFFHTGRRTPKNGILTKINTIFHYVLDYVRFIFVVGRYDRVVINPSMVANCVRRDPIFCRIARFFGKRVIVFWRGIDYPYINNVIKKSEHIQKKLRNTLFKADHTIVLSKQMYDIIYSMGCRSPYSTATTILSSDLALSAPRNFDKNRLTLLFLARLTTNKGIMEALDTYKIVKARYPYADMLIAGDGSAMDSVRNRIEQEQIADVKVLGNVTGKDKYNAYFDSDIYLFPSYFEGMPNSVLEAMGMGLAVVTSKVGGVPDFFDNGRMGYIIDGTNPVEFAEAVGKIVDSGKMAEISEYNRKYAREHFLDDAVIGKFIDTINNV